MGQMENLEMDKKNQWVLWRVPAQQVQEDRLSFEMLEHNHIAGVLSFDYYYVDDMICFRYPYAPLQQIDAFFQKKEGDFSMLCFFCEAVLNVLEQGEEYLLSERGYLLLPEWIFWSSFEKRIALCYLPGREEGTKHEFVTLVEYLLEHTDHADKRAVSFIYGLYDLVTTEGVAVERLLQYIHEKRTEEASPNHTESAAKQREDAAVPWPQKESRQPQENISFALEPVLSEIPGRLQREFAKSWGTICCAAQKTELMVGRAQESDIYLPFAAVSRKHAVFFYENGRLYLMDMSSKNGTQLDGEKISASVKIPCRENVIVTFADISYRLVLH